MPSPLSFENGVPRVLYALWAISLAVVVFLSLRPGPELSGLFWNADKAAHLLAYLWLALLPALIAKDIKRMLVVSAALILFGALLEFGQMYVPGRMFSLADMGANTAGVVLGSVTGKLCWPKLRSGGIFKKVS